MNLGKKVIVLSTRNLKIKFIKKRHFGKWFFEGYSMWYPSKEFLGFQRTSRKLKWRGISWKFSVRCRACCPIRSHIAISFAYAQRFFFFISKFCSHYIHLFCLSKFINLTVYILIFFIKIEFLWSTRYLSVTIQNEMIECLGTTLENHLLEQIRDSPFFAIIMDKTQDILKIRPCFLYYTKGSMVWYYNSKCTCPVRR